MNDLITMQSGKAVLNTETASKIAEFERQIKVIKEQEDALKEAILSEMEGKGILKIDTGDLLINYIAPTDRETFDSKQFRADHPDLFDEYVKFSTVKAQIRIKVR